MQNNHVLLYFLPLSLAQVYLIESAGSPATAGLLYCTRTWHPSFLQPQQGRKAALAIEELP